MESEHTTTDTFWELEITSDGMPFPKGHIFKWDYGTHKEFSALFYDRGTWYLRFPLQKENISSGFILRRTDVIRTYKTSFEKNEFIQ